MAIRGNPLALLTSVTTSETERVRLQVVSALMVGLLAAGIFAVTSHFIPPVDLVGTGSASGSRAPATGGPHDQITEQQGLEAFDNLPLSFIPNAGQTDDPVRYYTTGPGRSFFFAKNKAVVTLSKPSGGVALHLRFLDANPDVRLTAAGRLQGRANHLSASDQSASHTGLPTYSTVVYRDLWPGIDMRFQGADGRLKYEFRVHRGANPSDIRLSYGGAESLSLGTAGAMSIHSTKGTLKDARPVSYQWIGGRKVQVASRYDLGGGTSYGFDLGSYNSRHPLTVDPSLDYSTFIGGCCRDEGTGIFVEGRQAYVTGQTHSNNYPTTSGAFDNTRAGADVFVTKLNPPGSQLIYSTFIGGSDVDVGEDIYVDNGEAFITGVTFSPDFPTTTGAYDTTQNGEDDAFVTKLNRQGSALEYSTFLGGIMGDQGRGIDVHDDSAYVTGVTFSPNFPTTTGAEDTLWNGSSDAFVTKLNPTGSSLEYSTFLGGLLGEEGQDVAVEDGEAYVTGFSESPLGFPTTAGAYDETHNGARDVFATKYNSAGSDLVYSTFVGHSADEEGFGIAVQADQAYVTGYTRSASFPTTGGSFDQSYNGGDDAFALKLNSPGSALLYSTFLGGSNTDRAEEVVVSGGNAFIPGQTNSTDFPVTGNAFDSSYNGGIRDAFLTELNGTGSALEHSTYLGGSARDQARDVALGTQGSGRGKGQGQGQGQGVFLTGFTTSGDFPTTPQAWDTTYNGDRDVFVTKFQG
jgi:hypothetical protein